MLGQEVVLLELVPPVYGQASIERGDVGANQDYRLAFEVSGLNYLLLFSLWCVAFLAWGTIVVDCEALNHILNVEWVKASAEQVTCGKYGVDAVVDMSIACPITLKI